MKIVIAPDEIVVVRIDQGVVEETGVARRQYRKDDHDEEDDKARRCELESEAAVAAVEDRGVG